jgi:hypothetical protein
MIPNIKRLTLPEAALRVLVDLITVHAAMIGAMVISTVYQAMNSDGSQAQQLARDCQLYYVKFLWFLCHCSPRHLQHSDSIRTRARTAGDSRALLLVKGWELRLRCFWRSVSWHFQTSRWLAV